jgi:hypothetical protein
MAGRLYIDGIITFLNTADGRSITVDVDGIREQPQR